MPVDHQVFLREFTLALRDGTAALFVGAGMSRAAGHVDWKGLLRDIADDLQLDIDRETDLVSLAQFHVNSRGARDRLNQKLIDEFIEDVESTPNHRLMASLPVSAVWTTNYDDLIEGAFEKVGKRADVKRRPQDFGTTRRRADLVVYKMHGDRTLPADAVLTKEDYETYDTTRQTFTIALKGDLLNRTFLFLGFSFTDPNIMYILGRVKQLLEGNSRQHFCILRPPSADDADSDYLRRRFDHWLSDLRRYNIQAVLIDRYEHVTDLLTELNRRSHLRDVFISGSASDFQPLGEERFRDLCRALGSELIRRGFNIINGFGLGVGDTVIAGAMQQLPRNDEERLQLWPFPQVVPPGADRERMWTDYRERMIAGSGVCIVLAGNKIVDGHTVPATGVREEVSIARAQGNAIIPIGVTGHVAREVWDACRARPQDFRGANAIANELAVLGNAASSVDALVNAVIDALRALDR